MMFVDNNILGRSMDDATSVFAPSDDFTLSMEALLTTASIYKLRKITKTLIFIEILGFFSINSPR